ncbi:hypothetical protein ACQKMZ_28955 [Bacillus paramycoides]|uniref:hypothetical protein n=1 Tax=Bacillus paramycoides TaxID=2026194 RepID=UPI003D08E6E1
MGWLENAQKWFSFEALEKDLRDYLIKIKDNEKELEELFYRNVEFGTGGMRGELGLVIE